MSLRLDTLSFLPQGSMELVEVLGCFTEQILKCSNWTQIPTNHLNLKNYCFTLTIVFHVLLWFTVPPFLWRMVVRMLAFFFYQFSMLLKRLVSSPGNLLLNGGFNFHVNYPSDSTTSQFLDLLNCFYLDIFNLCTPTRVNNNVLDLIITRSGETSVSNLSVHDPVISDHFNLQSTAAWLSRNHLTRNSLSWLENYATLIQTVYVLIFAPLH